MTVGTVHVQGISAGSLSSIRSGSFVSFMVKGSKGKGIFTVLLNGRILQVQSKSLLIPGRKYRAEFIKYSGQIELRILEKQQLTTKVIDAFSLPRTDEMKQILSALMNTGLAVSPPMITALQRGSNHIRKKDSALFRLLAIMLDKNIPLTTDTVEPLCAYLPERQSKRENRDPEKDEDYKTNDASDVLLKKYILRDDRKDTLLKFFNHSKGNQQHWLIIPLKYRTDTIHSGILKIKLDIRNKLLGLHLTLEDSVPWEFILRKEQPGYKLQIFSPIDIRKGDIESMFFDLKEKLHKKGIKTDDISSNGSLSDGFIDTLTSAGTSIDQIV